MSTTIYDGTFTGSATTAGGAGTTTGVADTASVGTANAWTDVVGGAYHLDGSGNLTHNSISTYTSQTILARPGGEASNDHSVECQWTWDGSTQVHIGPILRHNGNNFYWPSLRAYPGGGNAQSAIVHQFINGVVTYSFAVDTGTIWVSGHRYRAIWKAAGFSPTTISIVVYDLDSGTPSTPVFSRNFTDSTAGVQTAGSCGFMGWDPFGTLKVNRVIILNETTTSPATGYSLTGPSTCTVGSASSNFTVTLTPSGGTNAGTTITPSDGGGGGTFTPSTVSLSTGTPSATFTYTAASSGTKTISTTNSGSLSNPSSLSVTASAPASPATGYSLTGPSTCTVGTASSNFTVTLTPSGGTSSGVTITPSDSSGGGTFTPSTVSLSTGTPSATFTYTAGSTGTKTISATNSGSLSNPSSLSVTASAPPLVMGALSVSSRTTTSITVGWSAATGGTGSKSYALYRYTSAPFTPPGTGVLVGTTSSTSLTDSSPGTGNVYYRVIVTDGASSTSTSVQNANQTALITRVLLPPIVLGLIGDSITANMGTAASFISVLAAQEPTRSVSLGSNQGVSGTTSADWLPGGSYLPGALSAFAAAGVTHVPIMLGTNDSHTTLAMSASTYASNIAAIAAACVSAGFKVCLNAPPYVVPGTVTAWTWDESSLLLLTQYRDSLQALTNGTTILLGDTQMFDVVASNPGAYLSDGVHYNGTGNTQCWNRWAAS